MVDPRQSSLLLKDSTSWKGPTLEQLMGYCSLWEGFMLEEFMEDGLLQKLLHDAAGQECASPPSEEQGAEETAGDELNATACSPVPLMGEGRENQE